jgi:DnaJ-class molecular chaperone
MAAMAASGVVGRAGSPRQDGAWHNVSHLPDGAEPPVDSRRAPVLDLYRILQITPGATASEIRTAFLKLAFAWHPDRNRAPEAEETFKRISAAYDVLSDPDKRREHDGGQSTARARERPPRARRAPAHPPEEIHVRLALSYAEAMTGCVWTLPFTRKEPCPRCVPRGGALRRCALCRGTAVMKGNRSATVSIPPDVREGQVLRYAGLGHVMNGVRGDLMVTVRLRPQASLKLVGDDFHTEKRVADETLRRGGTIRVRGPVSTFEVKVPPHTATGTTLRLRDVGMGGANGRGSIYVTLLRAS